MQNRSIVSRTLLVAVCAFSCASQAHAGYISASFGWAGNLFWNSEPAKIVRYTATGAVSGMAIVGSYFAYNNGLKGNLTKVVWGGALGGCLGMLCSQLYGVKASVKKIEKIVIELRDKVGDLTVNVQQGFSNVQGQLANISSALKNCATFEALEKVKQELMLWIHAHAQSQKEDTRRQIAELEQRLQQVVTQDHDAIGRIEKMVRGLVARDGQPIVVNVSNSNSNAVVNSNENMNSNSNKNSNRNANLQNNSMRQNNMNINNSGNKKKTQE